MFWKTRFGRIAVLAVMAAAFLAVSVAPSSAQGFDYKKIRTDDRTYVFNNAANAEPVQDPPTPPPPAPPYKFSGLMFGDYYYFF